MRSIPPPPTSRPIGCRAFASSANCGPRPSPIGRSSAPICWLATRPASSFRKICSQSGSTTPTTPEKAYEPLIISAEERALYDEFNASWAEYLAGVKEVLVLSRKNEDKEARLLHAKASLAGVHADETLQKDVLLNNKGADAAGSQAEQSFDDAIKMVLASLLLAIILGI